MVRQDNMVMMSDMELESMKKETADLKKEIEELRSALLQVTRDKEMKTDDILLSMRTFYNLVMSAQSSDDGMEDDIYGHDVTVHFHGMYCNCMDGAIAHNYIIEGVNECAEEYEE